MFKKEGFIFDGYPRNVAQAIAFDEYLNENNWPADVIINIDAPDETIVERLGGRRSMP